VGNERLGLSIISGDENLTLPLNYLGMPGGVMFDVKTASSFMAWLEQSNWLNTKNPASQLTAGYSMFRAGSVFQPVEFKPFQNPFDIYSGTVEFLRQRRTENGGSYFSFWAVKAGWQPPDLFWNNLFDFMEEGFILTGGDREQRRSLLNCWRLPLRHMSTVIDRTHSEQPVVVLTGGDFDPNTALRLGSVEQSRFWGGVSNLMVGAVGIREKLRKAAVASSPPTRR